MNTHIVLFHAVPLDFQLGSYYNYSHEFDNVKL